MARLSLSLLGPLQATLDGEPVTGFESAKVRALLVSFLDEWFKRYGTTFIAHYPDYVMHGGITMSVDEVGALNPEMFQEFFRDELVLLAEHFGGLGIHCCADARHQWGNFRELPGLKVMNHNAPPTRDARKYLLDSVRFYGKSVAQVPKGWTPDGTPDTWPAQFPEGTRVVLDVPADDAASAATIASRLQELREGLKEPGLGIETEMVETVDVAADRFKNI